MQCRSRLFHPVFLAFPQGISVLHSFCTRQPQFSIARRKRLPHIVNSACVRCSEALPGLRQSWRYLTVLEGEPAGGFPKTRFARSGTRALRPPQMVCLKWRDRAAGSNQSLRVASCKPPSQDERLQSAMCRSALRNGIPQSAGFKSAHLIAASDERAQNITRAMRPGWLAWAACICSVTWHAEQPLAYSVGVLSVKSPPEGTSTRQPARTPALLIFRFRRLRQIRNCRDQFGIQRLQIQLLC